MSSIVIAGDTSGSVTLQAPAVSGTTTITLPATSGTLLQSGTTVTEAQGGTGTTTGYYGFKNRIINGDMRIDQRNAGASVTGIIGSVFPIDRWPVYSTIAGRLTAQQSTVAPPNFINSLLVTSTAATTFAATDEYEIWQKIEGFNVADFGWGTANAKSFTLSFWVRSSLTGTFGGVVTNGSYNRSYVFSYTISTANTWEQKSITIAGDTTGTWITNNGNGLYLSIDLGSGASYKTTAGVWNSGYYTSPTGSINLLATNGATLYITGVQLEKGSTATSFDVRPYATEFALCQRYFQTLVVSTGTGAYISGFVADSASTGFGVAFLPVPMRTAPALSITLAGGTTKYRANLGTVNDNSDVNPVISGSTPTSFRLNFNSGFSALTANASGWITNRDSTTGYFGATAEL